MKIRKSFVTNSSSSSFVCEVCGNSEAGYDASMADCGMVQCPSGHVFCASHKLEPPLKEKQDELIHLINKSDSDDTYHKERFIALIKSAKNDDEIDNIYYEEGLIDFLYFEDSSILKCECPICNFDALTNYDLKEYIERKYHLSTDKLCKEIKQSFPDYESFRKYLSKNK